MVDEATRQNDIILLNSLPRMNESVVKKHYPYIINHINEFLNPEIHSYSFKHKLCYYFNNLKTFPKCKICGNINKREIYLFPAGFNDANLYTCCKKCALIYGSEKAKQTSMQKYGVTNVSFLKEIQEKKNKTCLEHYGVTNPSKSKEICDKRVETILEKYGTTNINELPEIKQKIKNTCLERYGVENAMYSTEFVEKLKHNNLEKFGSEWYLGTDDCLEKTKKTVMEKYGVEWITKDKNIRDRISTKQKNRTTKDRLQEIVSLYESHEVPTHIIINCYKRIQSLNKYLSLTEDTELKERILIQLKRYQDKIFQKYGTLDLSLDQIKDINKKNGMIKSKNTCLQLYGTDNVNKLDSIKNKIIQTSLKKFGSKYYILSEKFSKHLHIINMKKRYNMFLSNEFSSPEFTFEYYIDGHEDDILTWKCKKCGRVFKDYRRDYFHGVGRCLKCYPISINISKAEKEIVNFLKSIGIQNIIENDRSLIKKELDIICPDEKIAIEFDGVHWHTTEFITESNYHLNKTRLCNDKGYQLIHIFENEWIEKRDIVYSRIKSIFNKYDNRIFARKCIIKEVCENDKKIFLNNNHLQGNCISKYNIGLYYNNELVSLMTFGGYRYNLGRISKENEYEMLRFCNKLNTTVIGGASKLLNYFIKTYKPIKIISYADKRWSNGKLYEKLGFNWKYDTQPNYYYNIKDHLENRFNWRKSELPNKLKIFDENLSEVQNMKNNGYYQIFDCGSKLYELIL